jgi:hypothetical protein
MIARTDGRFLVCSFCSVLPTLLHHVSRKIPTVDGPSVVTKVQMGIRILAPMIGRKKDSEAETDITR